MAAGDGLADQQQTYVKNADNSTSTTTRELRVTGAVLSQIVKTSSANGLVETTKIDADYNGVFERTTTQTTVINANLSRIETTEDTSASGALFTRTVETTSADAGTVTTDIDRMGVAAIMCSRPPALALPAPEQPSKRRSKERVLGRAEQIGTVSLREAVTARRARAFVSSAANGARTRKRDKQPFLGALNERLLSGGRLLP